MANRLRTWAAGKLLGDPVYPRSGLWSFDWLDAFGTKTPTDEDFTRARNQAHKASVVMGCVEFLVANGTSTPWQLTQPDGEIVPDHPVLDLLNAPMIGFDASTLLAGIFQSLALDGNAYGIKSRLEAATSGRFNTFLIPA